MIDSLEIGYLGQPVGRSELDAFRRSCVGNLDVKAVQGYGEDEAKAVRWSGVIPGLGRLTLNSDGFVQHKGSLQKTRQVLIEGKPESEVTNVQVLSHWQANETFACLAEKIESVLPFIEPETLRVTRADIVYQRFVKSSFQTITALRGAIKSTRKGCAWFDNSAGVPTGIMLRGNAVAHRAYDKGLESLDKAYYNCVRSEEQLRSRAVGLGKVVCMSNRTFDREACREILNDRYLDVAYEGDLDVTRLVLDGAHTQALLVLHPELLPVYRTSVKKRAFYAMSRKVKEARASAIPDDLRVPEHAWEE